MLPHDPSSFFNSPAFDRRSFLRRSSAGIGAATVAGLLAQSGLLTRTPRAFAAAPNANGGVPVPGALGHTHFAPKAKRVIYLFQGGGPSHLDLFDYKPHLEKVHGEDMPAEIMGTQRVTLMTRSQSRFQAAKSPFKFAQHGESGAWFSEIVPNMASMADELCFLKALHSEPINHDPAVTFFQSGRAQPGLPSIGSWLDYGLGSENSDLPAYVVMIGGTPSQPIAPRYYSSGFLPPQHQGVQFQSQGDPVLFLTNPAGMSHENRGELVDGINELNRLRHEEVLDPEIEARINSFELAFRMQTSVPALAHIQEEPQHVLDLYGPDVTKPGTYAYQCLLARRLMERDVRCVQIFHAGWDHHGNLVNDIKKQCRENDRPSYGLIQDLKNRGMLDDTLVIWAGEFGRTAYGQGDSNGRDHHPRCFTAWMAGGGVKAGASYGKTDDYGYNYVDEMVHVNDFHATILHLLGIDHERFTYHFKGRDFRLTDVAGRVVKEILA